MELSLRGRADWIAHFGKALLQQHHTELLPILRPHIAADAHVLDVGAHAGQFTKLFARMAPRGHVYAVEPGQYARSILSRVVKLRRIRNVSVLPFGLSDQEATMALQVPIKARGSIGFGLSHLGAPETHRRIASESIRVTTIDRLLGEFSIPRIDFIKSDIEGWEIRMLRGAMIAVARFRPGIMLELVRTSAARANTEPDEAWDLLGPLGYQARKLPDLTPAAKFAGDGDYIFSTR